MELREKVKKKDVDFLSLIERFFSDHESRPNHRERGGELESFPNGELLQALHNREL